MSPDASILLWIQENLRGEPLDLLFSAFTHLGDHGLLFIALGLLLAAIPKTRRVGVTVLTALLLGALVTNVTLKPLVARTRPWLAVEGLIPLVEEGDPLSFPSGHTTAAFAFAVSVLCAGGRRRRKLLSLAPAVLMGFSRLYVGVHYPTDVLAGAVIGACAGFAADRLWSRILKKYKKSSS